MTPAQSIVLDFTRNHFELFGLPASYAIDPAALERAYRELQRTVHPDRHATSGDAARRLALQAAARVNEGYRVLGDPVERARYLLELRGVDAFDETDTSLDPGFLERQLERRERATDAADAGDAKALETLLAEVRHDAARVEAAVAEALASPARLAEARARVRELRFLGKVADDVGALLAEVDA
ncbi:MAG TPA: Fe-S protein assembly co-chaperone HscB [Casimicrobiaceae bacterium]|nr:Fe-S protein assembly co-chaperone HscB [Casimicrobiaceae bacterium]